MAGVSVLAIAILLFLVVPMIEVVVVSPLAPTTACVCDSGATPATPSIDADRLRVLVRERGAGAAVRAGGR